MMDFSAGAGASSGNELIPNGQLAWAIIQVRGVKQSQAGGQYIDLELTIDDGQPFARRKVWEMVGDPIFPGNSEEYRQMGMVAISRILESGRGAGPSNPGGYKLASYEQLNGLRVAIRIGISKGKDGYQDKNRVGEWLTPNPASTASKEYNLLVSGVYNKNPKSQQSPANPASAGSFGFGNGSSETGFQQPQEPGAQTVSSPATTTFPSEQGSGWLAQANR